MVPVCYWLKCGVNFIFLVLKTCFIISHSLIPDFQGVMCFLLCSYFCNVTVLIHLLLYVFGQHILSVCVGLFSFFIPVFCCLCVMIVFCLVPRLKSWWNMYCADNINIQHSEKHNSSLDTRMWCHIHLNMEPNLARIIWCTTVVR